MKTLTTTIILSVMFLSAGAFAGGSTKPMSMTVPKTEAADTANVTVVRKNGAWPIAGQISVDPCSLTRCIDI